MRRLESADDDEEAQMTTRRMQILPTKSVEDCDCLALDALQDLNGIVASAFASSSIIASSSIAMLKCWRSKYVPSGCHGGSRPAYGLC